ncbi:CAP domain-containing protein, partial [Frankia sp. AiPs1]|nr:CAP domain-containing protein [Frankia sp. AiPs1]
MQRTRNRHRAPRRPALPACGAAAGVLLATLVLALWVTSRAGPAIPGLAVRAAGGTSVGGVWCTGKPRGGATGPGGKGYPTALSF